MRLVSWNVNGLRACMKKGFIESCLALDADVYCLQETKVQEGQVELELPGYHMYWNYADKKGYSGTAVLTRVEPLAVTYDFGDDIHRHEGGFLSGLLLYAQRQAGIGADRLSDDLGGRLPGVPVRAGPEEAGDPLRGLECGS